MATFFNAIELPKAVSCAAVTSKGYLGLGSDDGSCRFFQLPEVKARRAIKGLGGEISCVVFYDTPESRETPSVVWLAFGREAAQFDLTSPTLVMDRSHALKIYNLLPSLQDDDDVLNEIACSSTHLAYTSDTGSVGVLDIKSGAILPMRTKHSNIAGSVSFIPDRPKELVSGGYDSHLLHFDFTLGTVLSRFDVGSTPVPSSGASNITLSPPFVISLAMSASGVIAAGTADGRIWLGFGGEKEEQNGSAPKNRRKKRRYWEGLKAEKESSIFSIADGPVIGVEFQSSDTIIAVSLGGTITKHRITTDEKGVRVLVCIWTCATQKKIRANTLRVCTVHSEKLLVVGGVMEQGRGLVEVWKDAQ